MFCELFGRDSERCSPGEGCGSVIIGGALPATHPCLNSLLPETPTPRRWEIGKESKERTRKEGFVRETLLENSFYLVFFLFCLATHLWCYLNGGAFELLCLLVKRQASKQEQSVNAFPMLQVLTFKIRLPTPISDLLPPVKILTTGKYFSRFRTSVSAATEFFSSFLLFTMRLPSTLFNTNSWAFIVPLLLCLPY